MRLFANINTQHNIMQIELWMMIANSGYKLFLQSLPEVKSTVSSSNTASRWCQNHYGCVLAFAVSSRYMQLYIYLCSDKKKKLEFTMLMCFRLQLNIGNISISVE